jgi:hypothetical protein
MVAFSPLGKGYLTGKIDEKRKFMDSNIRKILPAAPKSPALPTPPCSIYSNNLRSAKMPRPHRLRWLG